MRVPIAVLAIVPFIWMRPISADAQSRYLDIGISGIGVEAGFLRSEETTGFTLDLGYSSRGMSDIGITLAQTSGNIDIETLKSIAVKSLLDDTPLWFSVDVGVDQDRVKGMMANDLYDYGAIFGVDMEMTKAEL